MADQGFTRCAAVDDSAGSNIYTLSITIFSQWGWGWNADEADWADLRGWGKGECKIQNVDSWGSGEPRSDFKIQNLPDWSGGFRMGMERR